MSTRRPVARVHAVAGSLAFLVILAFLGSSAFAELSGNAAAVARVKLSIAWGLLLLVPMLAATGGSGVFMAGTRPKGLAGKKLARMRIIAANGLVVLVPAALFLAYKAGQGAFDGQFLAVQVLEYAAGLTNLALMGLNIRDGLVLSGHIRPSRRVPSGKAPAGAK